MFNHMMTCKRWSFSTVSSASYFRSHSRKSEEHTKSCIQELIWGQYKSIKKRGARNLCTPVPMSSEHKEQNNGVQERYYRSHRTNATVLYQQHSYIPETEKRNTSLAYSCKLSPVTSSSTQLNYGLWTATWVYAQ